MSDPGANREGSAPREGSATRNTGGGRGGRGGPVARADEAEDLRRQVQEQQQTIADLVAALDKATAAADQRAVQQTDAIKDLIASTKVNESTVSLKAMIAPIGSSIQGAQVKNVLVWLEEYGVGTSTHPRCLAVVLAIIVNIDCPLRAGKDARIALSAEVSTTIDEKLGAGHTALPGKNLLNQLFQHLTFPQLKELTPRGEDHLEFADYEPVNQLRGDKATNLANIHSALRVGFLVISERLNWLKNKKVRRVVS